MIKKIVIVLIIAGSYISLQAQCIASYTGIPCVGNPLQFKSGTPGAVKHQWNFNNEGFNNTSATPKFSFATPGLKTILYSCKLVNGDTCFTSFTILVKARPKVNMRMLTDSIQCYEGNSFCFVDSSLSGDNTKCLKSIKYLFSDGELITRYGTSSSPVKTPVSFCKTYQDPQGGVYTLTIEIEDCNGCITKVDFPVSMHVQFSPAIFAKVNYLSAFCQSSLTAKFKNLSQIGLKDIKKFKWIFDDGTEDSTNWDSVSHLYTLNGKFVRKFNPKLVIYTTINCSKTFDIDLITLYDLKPYIIGDKDSICSGETINWKFGSDSLKDLIPPGAVNWYTNPGLQKGYDISQSLSQPGPKMIRCNIQHPCGPFDLYDTVIVIGPLAKIEEPLIADYERYQCKIKDSVHVADMSIFYHNDRNYVDDDSLYSRKAGNLMHVFKKSLSSYTSMPAKVQKREGTNIIRLWNFNDDFCEQCTTDTKANQNTWLNCRYSKDSAEVHWYTPWDSIYNFKYSDIAFSITLFDKQIKTCLKKHIWASDSLSVLTDTILYYGNNALGIKTKDSSIFSGIKHKIMIPKGLTGRGFLDAPYPLRIYIPKNCVVYIDKKDGSSVLKIIGAQFYKVNKNERLIIKSNNDSCFYHYALLSFSDSIPTGLKQPWQREIKRIRNPKIQLTDSINASLHRQLFYNTIPGCFNITLNERDTVHPFKCEQDARASVALMPPSAKKLAIVGHYCLGYDTKAIDFSLDDTKPGCMRSFAKINPDYINTPNRWLLINDMYSGDKMLETANNPPPSAYSGYTFTGPASGRFFITYNDSFLANQNVQKINVALITGNGIAPNDCNDTVFYSDFASFPRLSANLKFVGKNDTTTVYNTCAKDTVYATIPGGSPITNLLAASSSWLMLDNANGDTVSMVIETYHQVETSLRYPNKKVNYTIIDKYAQINGHQKLVRRDTLFTAIVKTYKTKALPGYSYNRLKNELAKINLDINDFNDSNLLDVIWNNVGTIGNYASGSRGCIDTNGMDTPFYFYHIPLTYSLLSYKDSSMLPADSVYSTGKMVKAYGFQPPHKGVFSIVRNVESMMPVYCGLGDTISVVVGFYGKANFSDSIICKGNILMAEPYFRYYSIDKNMVGSLDPKNYWQLRKKNAGKKGFEGLTKWDYNKLDDNTANDSTIFGYFPYAQTGYDTLVLLGQNRKGQYYKNPGFYIARVAVQDSNRCTDTFSQNVYVTGPKAGFFIDLKTPNCKTILELFDTSSMIDPCAIKGLPPCDFINNWTIRWGDNTTISYNKALPKQIGHDYLEIGEYTIWLIVRTVSGCVDSVSQKVFIPGPKPKFTPESEIIICVGDTVLFKNSTPFFTNSSQWIWSFGDGLLDPQSDTGFIKHRYTKTGKFDVFLNQYDSIPNTGKYCVAIYPDTSIGQAKITVTVLPFDSVSIIPKPKIVCVGETIDFTAELKTQNQYSKYYWTFDNKKDSNNSLNYSKVIKKIGHHTLFWQADTNGLGRKVCPAYGRIDVYADSIKADFYIDTFKQPIFCFTNLSSWGETYRWGYYHEKDIKKNKLPFLENASQKEPDRFICENFKEHGGDNWVCLEATNSLGCKDTICKKVFNRFEIAIMPPNVFTPGGDDGFIGQDKDGNQGNNVFSIYLKGEEFYHLKIYNRWGILVFESEDKFYDWNGTMFNKGGRCPDGTYYYILEYRYKTREKNEPVLNGVVQLIW